MPLPKPPLDAMSPDRSSVRSRSSRRLPEDEHELMRRSDCRVRSGVESGSRHSFDDFATQAEIVQRLDVPFGDTLHDSAADMILDVEREDAGRTQHTDAEPPCVAVQL